MTSAAAEDCPMTEDCPGYDRDVRVCLVHRGDCEFAPADGPDDASGASESSGRDAPRAGGGTVKR